MVRAKKPILGIFLTIAMLILSIGAAQARYYLRGGDNKTFYDFVACTDGLDIRVGLDPSALNPVPQSANLTGILLQNNNAILNIPNLLLNDGPIAIPEAPFTLPLAGVEFVAWNNSTHLQPGSRIALTMTITGVNIVDPITVTVRDCSSTNPPPDTNSTIFPALSVADPAWTDGYWANHPILPQSNSLLTSTLPVTLTNLVGDVNVALYLDLESSPNPISALDVRLKSPSGTVVKLFSGVAGDAKLDVANDVAIDASGKIIAVGVSHNGSDEDFAVVRYNSDRTFDLSFGSDGIVTTDIGNAEDKAYAVAIDSNGKIVVAGYSLISGGYDFAVARYNDDGSLDTTFSGDGKTTTDLGFISDTGSSVAIDGTKIVVIGGSYNGTNWDFSVARYNDNGSLDTTFNSNGMVTLDLGAGDDFFNAGAIDANGKIVAGGYTWTGSDFDFAVVRYNSNGSLDTGFDPVSNDGIVVTGIGTSYDFVNALAIEGSKIVVAGDSWNGVDYDIALARYLSDGSLDPGFSNDGKTTTNTIFNGNDYAHDVAIDGSNIVVAGLANKGTNDDGVVARYTVTGTLDTSFDNGDGYITFSTGRGDDGADFTNALAVNGSGIVVAGKGCDSLLLCDFSVVRFELVGGQTWYGSPPWPFDRQVRSFGTRSHHVDADLVGDPLASLVLDDDSAFYFAHDLAPNVNPTAPVPFNKVAFHPDENLSAFNGEDGNGIWTLEVRNGITGTTGTLLAWFLDIEEKELTQYHIYLPRIESKP